MSKNKTDIENAEDREALIAEICDQILNFPARAQGQTQSTNEGKSHTVVIPDIETEHGKASLTYHLKASVADFFKEFEGCLDSIYLERTDGARSRFDLDQKNDRETVLSTLVQYATVYMIMGLKVEVEAAINKVFKKAIIYAAARTMSRAVSNNEHLTAKIDLRESWTNLKKKIAKEKKADEYFVNALSSLDHVHLPTSKGRPATWDKSKIEQAVIRARSAFKKRKYRAPTLKELALEISKRQPLTEASLKMLLKRHGLSWRAMKK
jgi:hypothetical protein